MGFYANETIWDEEEVGRVKVAWNNYYCTIVHFTFPLFLFSLLSHFQLVINSMKNNLAFNSHSVAYHSLLYTNGTECDLTKKPRKTLVKV